MMTINNIWIIYRVIIDKMWSADETSTEEENKEDEEDGYNIDSFGYKCTSSY
jgi:hypothetical protein